TACSRNSGEYFLLPFILTFYLYSWKKRCLLLCYQVKRERIRYDKCESDCSGNSEGIGAKSAVAS
ncbi:hypothetical protein, partial [Leptospira interrogans]|uniref:hypothetical protein n=1 Tax=Leptospira interrogans TaxID=173 RepID=UPI0005B3AAC7